jgi:cation diffusion facilitator CzcD-associated flavoprotein CzcO
MQPEIHQYFRSVAQKYNIIPHIRFRSIVEKAQWDPETATWLVTITNASKKTYTKRSKFIISAVGGLSIPKQCDIPGAEKFKGALFHSAEWDHSIKLAGKEVVTIGELY